MDVTTTSTSSTTTSTTQQAEQQQAKSTCSLKLKSGAAPSSPFSSVSSSNSSPWICGPNIRFDQDDKSHVEIRPNRKLMIRKVTIHSKPTLRTSRSLSCDMMEADSSQQLSKVAILFVHGSCAASSQFSPLVHHLAYRIKIQQNQNSNGHLTSTRSSTSTSQQEEAKEEEEDKEEEEEEPKTTSTVNMHKTPEERHGSTNPKRDIDILYCHLFDFFGCGESKPSTLAAITTATSAAAAAAAAGGNTHTSSTNTSTIPFRYTDYSEKNMELDLEFVLRSLLACSVPLFIVAHSYATSQVIKLVTTKLEEAERLHIRGAVFIGGALKDCPDSTVRMKSKDGGLALFYLPHYLLQMLQPTMSKSFVESAFHPNFTNETVKSNALRLCNNNSMRICQAFYQQKRYATSDDAKKFTIPTLVLHGQDDQILPKIGGEHLASSLPCCVDFLTFPDTSHQVFEEEPALVGDAIFQFICDHL
jgi:pimeloyl-ACP methyl ester carboxylesterase